MKKAREEGKKALKTSPRPGRPPKLSEEERTERLPSLLEKGSEHFGFRGEVWTRKRVRKDIEEEFGAQVRCVSGRSDSRVGSGGAAKNLTTGPTSATKRRSRSGKRRSGRESKKAETDDRTVMFVDEAGFYQLPAAVRTYAPRGQTSVLRAPLNYDNLSAISGITPAGKLYMRVLDGSIRGTGVA